MGFPLSGLPLGLDYGIPNSLYFCVKITEKKSLSKVKEEAAKWENTFARPLLFDMRKQININNPYLFRRSTTALALDIG